MDWAALLPIAFRILGLSKITPWALKLLPLILKYGPIVETYIVKGTNWWTSFKKDHPTVAAWVEKVASKVLPGVNADEAAITTALSILRPRARTPAQEKLWNNRGMLPANPDTGDFPTTMN